MLVAAGDWLGRGSFRTTNETVGTTFRARIKISDDIDIGTTGYLIDVTLEIEGAGQQLLQAWIAADEFGTYAVNANGFGTKLQGIAKLESEPHLGLLNAEDGTVNVAVAVFAARESHGVRGFARTAKGTWTWELAIEPAHRRVREKPSKLREGIGNVVSLASRRRKRNGPRQPA